MVLMAGRLILPVPFFELCFIVLLLSFWTYVGGLGASSPGPFHCRGWPDAATVFEAECPKPYAARRRDFDAAFAVLTMMSLRSNPAPASRTLTFCNALRASCLLLLATGSLIPYVAAIFASDRALRSAAVTFKAG